MIAGCGVGPLGPAHRNHAIRLLFAHADTVVVRDHQSAGLLTEELKLRREIAVTLDPAFLWIKQNLAPQPEPRADVILLALRDWPLHEYGPKGISTADGLKLKQRMERELLKFVDVVEELSPSTTIIPFCMHTYPVGGDDRQFYRRLFAGRPRILDNLNNCHQSPADALKAFASVSAVLAMRFHGVVFAVATKTPFLALDYTMGGKVEGFLTDVGAEDRLLGLQSFDGPSAARHLTAPEQSPVDIDPRADLAGQALEGAFRDLFAQ